MGFGQVLANRRLKLPVPPAVQDMQTMRVEVDGEELFITFHVQSSSYFRVNGADIHTDCVISLSQAVLGGTAKIEGISHLTLCNRFESKNSQNFLTKIFCQKVLTFLLT